MATRPIPHSRIRRLRSELEREKASLAADCAVWIESAKHGDPEDDLSSFWGYVQGPAETPYDGGLYVFHVLIPTEYPFRPPRMRCINPIWHPNFCPETGHVCSDFLQDMWTPALTLRTTLLMMSGLLSYPPMDEHLTSHLNVEAAGQYEGNFPSWRRKARDWTKSYAHPLMEAAKAVPGFPNAHELPLADSLLAKAPRHCWMNNLESLPDLM